MDDAKEPPISKATSLSLGKPASHQGHDTTPRELADVYKDYPDMRLASLNGRTFELAGQTVRQITLEAAHRFVQKCSPLSVSERQATWDGLIEAARHASDSQDGAHLAIAIPEGILDTRGGKTTIAWLMQSCLTILASAFEIQSKWDLARVFNHGIAFCDAVGDSKQSEALAKAQDELLWLIVSLETKAPGLYQSASRDIEALDKELPPPIESLGKRQRKRRRAEEGRILEDVHRKFDSHKGPFRTQCASSLLALLEACAPDA